MPIPAYPSCEECREITSLGVHAILLGHFGDVVVSVLDSRLSSPGSWCGVLELDSSRSVLRSAY